MPNWCNNTLRLGHIDPKMIDKAIQGYNECELLSTFCPLPESEDAFMTAVNTWGTKWDVGASSGGGDGYVSKVSDNLVYFCFVSAWSPPVHAYEKMMELGFSVDAMYHESGCAFCGIWDNGSDDYYELVGDSFWVVDNIPEKLNLTFGISESMADWEYEEIFSQIEDIKEKIEGEGCEETCQKLREELEVLQFNLNRYEVQNDLSM